MGLVVLLRGFVLLMLVRASAKTDGQTVPTNPVLNGPTFCQQLLVYPNATDVIFNPVLRKVTISNIEMDLVPRDFAVLQVLVSNSGVVTFDQIFQEAYLDDLRRELAEPDDFRLDARVWSYNAVNRLRRALRGVADDRIVGVYGVGYYWKSAVSEAFALKWKSFEIALDQVTLKWNGHEVRFSKREMTIFKQLLSAKGHIVPRERLKLAIEGDEFKNSPDFHHPLDINVAVREAVYRIDEKFKLATGHRLIRTSYGEGYALNADLFDKDQALENH